MRIKIIKSTDPWVNVSPLRQIWGIESNGSAQFFPGSDTRNNKWQNIKSKETFKNILLIPSISFKSTINNKMDFLWNHSRRTKGV